MKPQLTILALSLALAGCNGSSDSNTSTPTYSISGTIAAQNIALDSKVCADLNQNFICDTNEPTVQANKNGEFTITHTSKDILNKPLLAALDSAQTRYLVAPGLRKTTGNVINGVSSIVAGLVANGMTDTAALTYLEKKFKTLGVDINGGLKDNLDDTSLTTLDKNIVSIMKQVNNNKRIHITVQISNNLTYGSGNLLLHILSPENAKKLTLILEGTRATSTYTELNDTGIKLYYSDTDEDNKGVESPQIDYPGQDADFGFDKADMNSNSGKGFKFVKLDAKGTELSDDATEWSCISDKRSNLIWEVKKDSDTDIQGRNRHFALEIPGLVTPYKEDLALATCEESKDSICSTQDYAEYLNGIELCGKNDWRLPTDGEIYNIIDFGETEVDSVGDRYGLTAKYFPNQTDGGNYNEHGRVWTNSLGYTTFDSQLSKGSVNVRLVSMWGNNRGLIEPFEIFTVNTDPDSSDSFLFSTRLVSTEGK